MKTSKLNTAIEKANIHFKNEKALINKFSEILNK